MPRGRGPGLPANARPVEAGAWGNGTKSRQSLEEANAMLAQTVAAQNALLLQAIQVRGVLPYDWRVQGNMLPEAFLQPWLEVARAAPQTQAWGGRNIVAPSGSVSGCPAPHRSQTTQTVKNMPGALTRDMLRSLLDTHGFINSYDFLYLPIDFSTQEGFGYAIINFTSVERAHHFQEVFHNFSNWPVASDRLSEVTAVQDPGHMGLKANIERYRNNRVMHPSVPDEYKPILLVNGKPSPFPAPSTRIRPPTKLAPNVRRTLEDGTKNIAESTERSESRECKLPNYRDSQVHDRKPPQSAVEASLAHKISLDAVLHSRAKQQGLAQRVHLAGALREHPLEFSTALSWRLAMRSGMVLDLPKRRSTGSMRDVSLGRCENAAWRLWTMEVSPGRRIVGDFRRRMQALARVPCLLCATSSACRCLRLNDVSEASAVPVAADFSGRPSGLVGCLIGAMDEDSIEGDLSQLAAKRRLCALLGDNRSRRIDYKIWRGLAHAAEVERSCTQPEVRAARRPSIRAASGVSESAEADPGRTWRIAMRAGAVVDLPDRRSQNRMRDCPVGRWENAAWRLWAKESGRREGKPADPLALRNKLKALSAMPCLLCGVKNRCSCLQLEEAKPAPVAKVAEQIIGPPPGLGTYLRGSVDVIDVDVDEEEDLSKLAAKRRLCALLGADKYKEMDYKLWRRLASRHEPHDQDDREWWPRTPEPEYEYDLNLGVSGACPSDAQAHGTRWVEFPMWAQPMWMQQPSAPAKPPVATPMLPLPSQPRAPLIPQLAPPDDGEASECLRKQNLELSSRVAELERKLLELTARR